MAVLEFNYILFGEGHENLGQYITEYLKMKIGHFVEYGYLGIDIEV